MGKVGRAGRLGIAVAAFQIASIFMNKHDTRFIHEIFLVSYGAHHVIKKMSSPDYQKGRMLERHAK